MKQNQKMFNLSQWSVLLIFAVIIIVIINVIAYSLPLRFDLTSKGLYSLSNTSKKYLGQLEDQFNVHVYISDKLPAQKISSWDLKKYVSDLLSDMRSYSNGNFNYVINMIKDSGAATPSEKERSEKLREEANQRGIENVRIDIMEENQRVTRDILVGLFMSYGDKEEIIQMDLNQPYRLEYEILKKMRKMLTEESPASLLAKCKTPIEINLYYTPNNQEPANNVKSALTTVLSSFSGQDKGKLPSSLDNKNLPNLNISGSQESNVDTSTLNSANTKFNDVIIKDNDQVKTAQQDGVQINRTLILGGAQGLTEALVCLGVTIKYGNKKESIPSINPGENNFDKKFKKAIEGKIISLLSKSRKKIGYTQKKATVINQQLMKLGGNQGMQLHQKLQEFAEPFENPTLRAFEELSKDYYEMKKVDFESNELDSEDIDALIVISSNSPYSDWELFQIDQFIMKGKPVAFLVDSIAPDFSTYIPRGRFSLPENAAKRNHNLYDIAKHFGITFNNDLVKDIHSFYLQGFRYKLWIEYSMFPQDNSITNDFDLSVIFPWVGTMAINTTKYDSEKISYFPFIRCYKEAKLEKSNFNISIENAINAEAVRQENVDEEKRLSTGELEDVSTNVIGIALKGKFQSYFKGKTAPQPKPKDENADKGEGMYQDMMMPGAAEVKKPTPPNPDKKDAATKPVAPAKDYSIIPDAQNESRVVFVSDKDFCTDLGYSLFGMEYFSNNILLTQNIMDYLLANDEMNSVRGKSTAIANLDLRARQKSEDLTTGLGIFGIPVLIVILGLVIWFFYRNRKDTITKNFNN